jgi:hypothetical protein
MFCQNLDGKDFVAFTFIYYIAFLLLNLYDSATMANDLKVVESVNGMLSGQTWPYPDFVDGTYSLVQKIYKCLLSTPGEDIFDPSYGSGLRHNILGISGQEIERASQVISDALKRVVDNLSDPNISDPAQRLVALNMLSLEFDAEHTTWVTEVDVKTEAGSFPLTMNF